MQKELVILGAGESGVAAALLAKAKGIPVFVSDSSTIAERFRAELTAAVIAFEEGGHSRDRILAAAEVIKSPGIPDKVALIKDLDHAGIPVISDIEFAARYSKAHIVGITGSNGKTTTTLWTYHILKVAGIDATLSGNVGVSPCRQLADRDPAVFVMELSSFQLDRMYRTRVNTAVLTNITPDHLDRYDYKFENYINSKLRILQNQGEGDRFIWWTGDAVMKEHFRPELTPASKVPFSLGSVEQGSAVQSVEVQDALTHLGLSNGDDCQLCCKANGGKTSSAIINGDSLHIEFEGKVLDVQLDKVALKGRHNLCNAMAASLAALSAGASPEAVAEGLASFEAVEHRLEPCGEVDGVLFINDSKATNTDSAWYALDSMTRPVVWIAGGTDKGNDYRVLEDLARSKVKALICMGVDNSKLIKAFEGVVSTVVSTASLDDAFRAAIENASSGDVVLLSPACASFDLFKNYEQRGKLFKEKVKELL